MSCGIFLFSQKGNFSKKINTKRMLRSRVLRSAASSICIRRISLALQYRPTHHQTPTSVNVRFFADHGTETASRAGQYLLNKDDVLTRVLDVVKNFEKVDASKVTAESHFINDLGLDSLDVVEVVMALEQEFVLDIPDHDAEKIQSIQDAVEYISQNPMAK
jgi:NADH dehydrogenase (ubiquinone) 1 alpha/beta subcomplex 1